MRRLKLSLREVSTMLETIPAPVGMVVAGKIELGTVQRGEMSVVGGMGMLSLTP